MEKKSNFSALMDEVCAKEGWCGGPRHVTEFIPERGPVRADQFVGWLFEAEGADPNADLHKWQKHKDRLRDAFVRHMGADIVDAGLLRWS